MSQSNTVATLRNENHLSSDLIEAQYTLKNSWGKKNAKSVLILVSGIELAGKGESVKQLREWVDPRYLNVKADPPYMLSNDQAFWQPYVNFIPREGQIAVMFGNWYSDLLTTAMHVSKPLDETLFDAYVENMRAFEQDLKNNHVDVVKVWFDLSWKSLQKRLDHIDASERHWHKLHGLDWRNKKQYDNLQKLRQRFTQDWIIIDGEDPKRRDQSFAHSILQALKHLPEYPTQGEGNWPQALIPQELLHPAIEPMQKDKYKKKLKKLTRRVAEAMRYDERKVMIVFEGMDAAGKGGSIKRIIKRLDPREYDIFTISAPEKYELRHPYLWRFWTKLENCSDIRIFDRSWYGRVLVERVEGFANELEWQRAYDEINRFEKDLMDSQTVIIKFWLSISKDEQERRFQAREKTPHKRFKITEDDWRNRSKWNEYLNAAADVFERTSTDCAPWAVIATDDKYTARIQILKTILKRLKTD
ncbi:phosphate--AMP phosphotransferase [Acinetobacter sp. S40]|uniref:polyphosphate:AMP phosphotransferase n=1 Tax=unclassified Acinetobacter TaxID=196816 RepID=UPI00190E4002|nr:MULTISPECIES: phosphate--AMP phosphotransferase [unclassified Acinetobacter]MBJ9984146.1 phosphate--AMP phosphotransferase [Acinetobacter sp. S40]MBK0062804.1 phosphate--AMP phosphotransferase [Acinetobacter sp. S55]MBK0065619.1 phosphate--AMP phosphotransferase [Acinetobacter sp. S54]